MPHLGLSVIIRQFPGECTGRYLPVALAFELVARTRVYLEEYRFPDAVEQALTDYRVDDLEMWYIAKSVLASYMGRHSAKKAAAHREIMRTVDAIYKERREMERWLLAHEAHEDTHPVDDSVTAHAFVVDPEYRHPDFEEPAAPAVRRRKRPRIRATLEQSGQYRLVTNGFGRIKLPPIARRRATRHKALRMLHMRLPVAHTPQLLLDLPRINAVPL